VRVPLSWLHEFVDPGLSAEGLADVLTAGGLEVEAVERPTGGARGVTVVEVRSAAPVPGSDKLTLVQAFDGEREWEIVCGARNYRVGDKVPAALPGAVLPGPDPTRPVEIGRRKLMGIVSNGMLASARELGIGDDHRGIWILDRDAPVGADLTEWLDLDDAVLDIDVTPDRGYALSILGVARDVAALTGAELRVPEPLAPDGDPGVPVVIDDAERCRRFDARRITGVRVGPSPAWLQRRLAAAGMRPISNIVDATNYAMLETGNPIHAYDVALLAGPLIEVRTARPGETLHTLDGVERELDPDDLVIADADGPVGLAGVMGGAGTEINDGTTDVLLEVANFSAATVLRTARRHGLHTEGSRRWERMVPTSSAPVAATVAAGLITRHAGGAIAGGIDHYPGRREPEAVRLRPARARSLLGLDLDTGAQQAALEAIGCTVNEGAAGELAVVPPAYRPDLLLEVDLYEEIVRIHGYDRVPETVPSSGAAGGRSPRDVARRAVRRALAGAGWTEVMPFPFVADADLAALGLDAGDPRRTTVALVNPLSKEESVLRTTLLPGLLRAVRHNANRQTTDLAIFETGPAFLPPTPEEAGADGGPTGVVLPAEPLMLALAAAGAFEPARHDRPPRPVDLYDLLGAVDVVRRSVGGRTLEARPTDEPPYHPGRAARVLLDGVDVGVVGELHPRVVAAYELPARTLAGELRLDRIVAEGVRHPVAAAPSPLPGLRFDVAVLVDEGVPAADVEAAVRAGAGDGLTELTLFDVFRGPQLGEGRKSLAYALRLDDPERQLSDVDEAAAIEAVARSVAARVGGRLRR
jgi:phenylalanyl-tRNA synthetase beta chain